MEQIADRYRLEESLGQSNAGEVFRAWDTQAERAVALRLLPPAADAAAEARFAADGEVLCQLRSAHIVPVFDMGAAADGRRFVATQLVEGQPLAARFAAGPVPVRALLSWGAQIAQALADAHAAGVVHRTLNPANVILEAAPEASTPVARVLDFGVAPGAPSEPDDPVGAPRYRPPEAWRGAEHGPAGDLYQLGLILHEGVRGAPCFEGAPAALMRAHLRTDPPPLDGVDASVSGTIMRLLVKSPGSRPQSAAEVAATLRVLAKTTPEAAQGLAPTDRGHWPAAQTNTPSIIGKVWVLTTLSLLLVLAGILISSRLGSWDLPGSRVVDAPPITFPQSTASGWILPPAAAAASAASARKAAAQARSPRRPSPAAPASARLIVDPIDATVRWGQSTCTTSPCDVPTASPIDVRVERADYESTTVRLTPGAVQRVRLAPIEGAQTP